MMKRWVCILSLLVAVAGGCGGGDSVVAVNNPPSISFGFKPLAVPVGAPVDLAVTVSDEDGDNLTVTWEITRGTLTPKNAARTIMTWDVPGTLGADTVTVRVSDGEDTATSVQEIRVGTLVIENPLPTYSLVESPYILRPTNSPAVLAIGNRETTTIEAGVEIFVDVGGTTIDVVGTLNIQGTPSQPVVIRANDRTLFCASGRDWWEGILVGSDQTNGVVNIDHTEIWYAKNGVHMRDSGRATITNSAIRCCGNSGVLVEGVGALVVSDSEISNIEKSGVIVSALTLLPQSISITDCNININGASGILIDLYDTANTVPITIEGNRFEFNFEHGISLRRWVWPSIHNNGFLSNGPGGMSSIRLFEFHSSTAPDQIDVSCNYWGAAVSNVQTIESTVYDRKDSPSLGTELIVAPWLNSDPYGQAVPPPCDGGTVR